MSLCLRASGRLYWGTHIWGVCLGATVPGWQTSDERWSGGEYPVFTAYGSTLSWLTALPSLNEIIGFRRWARVIRHFTVVSQINNTTVTILTNCSTKASIFRPHRSTTYVVWPIVTNQSINQSMLYCSVEQNVTEYIAKNKTQ